jgi:hypothetical protein
MLQWREQVLGTTFSQFHIARRVTYVTTKLLHNTLTLEILFCNSCCTAQGSSIRRGSLQSVGPLGRSISKVQEHANVALRPLSSTSAGVLLEDVSQHAPSLGELRKRMQGQAISTWRAYEQALKDYPLRTKALTSCVGLTLADMIAQAAAGGGWDILRTMKLASFGLLWHGVSVRFRWSVWSMQWLQLLLLVKDCGECEHMKVSGWPTTS